MWGYRSSDVARMLDLPVAEVRRLARAGFVAAMRGPRNELRFSFQDLVLLRAAAGLVHARVPPARVRRALRQLRAQLPPGRPLTGARVAADGERVVVQEGGARWRPDTGQVLLDFGVADLARKVAPIVRAARRARAPGPLDADAWYRWGRDLEDAAPAEAKDAYRRALALDHAHAGAHLNLGRLLHEGGDAHGAELHYRLALASPAHRALAAFNLGVALEDQGLLDEALLAYARALEADRALADAHFNASRLLERIGRRADALRHLAEYRRLTS
ncbi:MAG TPA: MerR family transcriptional regulator [Anaeromyxobacter sp.]|nr:MerR family transcriptional regulator [Anaeromyxobacter sp.]